MSVNVRFQFRRDTTANLASVVLAPGEPVYDITSGGLFVGDGTNTIGALPALGSGGGATGATGATGINEVYGTWVSATPYLARDVVVSTVAPYNTYIAKNDVTGTDDPTIDTTNWALLIQSGVTGASGATGLGTFYDLWDGTTVSYVVGDVVINTTVDNNTYVCIDAIASGGGNQTPDVDVAHWTLFVKAGATGVTGVTGIHSFSDTWDGTATSYVIGDVVVNAGVDNNTYVCIVDVPANGANQSPDLDTANWTLFVKAGAPGVTGETGGFAFSGETYAVLWSPDGISVTGTTGFQYNTGEGVTLDILNIQTTDTGRRVTIGYGATTTGTNSVAIGNTTAAGGYSVSIGSEAGKDAQGTSSVAIGELAGTTGQGGSAVALGRYAGQTGQGNLTVSIGSEAGSDVQGPRSVAIGPQAGQVSQGLVTGYSVAVGNQAGQNNQGGYSVAIGSVAGTTGQADNTIILNASGVETNGVVGQTGSFYVNPVRTIVVDSTSEIATLLTGGETYYQVFYSPVTYEFIYVTQAAAI